ncbi:hypothetical protein [Corynebacterium glyciniphilum]|nr:hypothetical protein [Corynebacterium glyciniphilum]
MTPRYADAGCGLRLTAFLPVAATGVDGDSIEVNGAESESHGAESANSTP